MDDLFTLFTFLDEQKCFDQLPTYVSDSPDHMPSVRLYEGDLNIVMSMLREFAGRLDQYGGVLAAIAKDVRDLQVTSTVIPLGGGSAPVAWCTCTAVCRTKCKRDPGTLQG